MGTCCWGRSGVWGGVKGKAQGLHDLFFPIRSSKYVFLELGVLPV